MAAHAWLIPFLPAGSFAVILLFGSRSPKQGAEVGILAVGASFVLSCIVAFQWIAEGVVVARHWNWWDIGPVEISVGTHAVQYGTGAFAGIRGYLDQDGEKINIFRLPEHAARLLSQAHVAQLAQNLMQRALALLVGDNESAQQNHQRGEQQRQSRQAAIVVERIEIAVERGIGESPQAAVLQVHDQEREVVERVDHGDAVVELDGVEQRGERRNLVEEVGRRCGIFPGRARTCSRASAHRGQPTPPTVTTSMARLLHRRLQRIAVTPANTASPAISDDEADALARTTVNLFKAWSLTDAEACSLLGGMSARTWARWKDGARVCVALSFDPEGDGSMTLLESWPVQIPWPEVHLHLIAVAYQATHHPPQGPCHLGHIRELAWRNVTAFPVKYARTDVFPRNVGVQQVPKELGFMAYDLRDIQRFGAAVDGAPQHPASLDRDQSLFTDSGHCLDNLFTYIGFAVGMSIGNQASAWMGRIERIADAQPDACVHYRPDGLRVQNFRTVIGQLRNFTVADLG